MSKQTEHQFFSADCFNEVWNLLERNPRTSEDDRLMREMAHASLFHWLQREDCDPSKISVGLWLVSRVHAVLGNGGVAAMYAEECLEISQVNALPPFYLGYAFEAAARAARERGAEEEFNQFLEKAEAQLEKVAEQEERALLAADLEALKA